MYIVTPVSILTSSPKIESTNRVPPLCHESVTGKPRPASSSPLMIDNTLGYDVLKEPK